MNDALPAGPRTGYVPVYAVAAGLAAAVPLPLIDGWLARTARGSAMRRVAERHGLTLSPEARRHLGDVQLPKHLRVRGYRVARAALQKSFFPMVPVRHVEDALAALGSSLLFDAYLRHRPFPRGTTVELADARTIRRSIDGALVHGATDLAAALPELAKSLASESWRIVRYGEERGLSRAEKLVDHVLDAIADVPENILLALELRLEQDLAARPS